eukprot:2935-Heterococcus_DN1.PRE.3
MALALQMPSCIAHGHTLKAREQPQSEDEGAGALRPFVPRLRGMAAVGSLIVQEVDWPKLEALKACTCAWKKYVSSREEHSEIEMLGSLCIEQMLPRLHGCHCTAASEQRKRGVQLLAEHRSSLKLRCMRELREVVLCLKLTCSVEPPASHQQAP